MRWPNLQVSYHIICDWLLHTTSEGEEDVCVNSLPTVACGKIV